MQRSSFVVLSLVLIAIGLGGCEKSAPPPPSSTDSGAEKVARAFFESLLHEDWSAAYDTLDSESKAWCGTTQFAALAQNTLKHVGFTPTEVNVAASENGERASAVATFRGVSGTAMKQHKDGTELRRTASGLGGGLAEKLRPGSRRYAAEKCQDRQIVNPTRLQSEGKACQSQTKCPATNRWFRPIRRTVWSPIGRMPSSVISAHL